MAHGTQDRYPCPQSNRFAVLGYGRFKVSNIASFRMGSATRGLASPYVWTLAVLVAAWVLLTMPWWFEGLSVPADSRNYYYPMLRGLARHLAQGDWPAWLPETYAGRPALADPQSLVAIPGFLALAWFNPAPSLRAMDMLVLSHLLVGAVALVVWALRRGAHPLAALFAALLFAFGGSAVARLEHTLLVLSYAWLPVAILALEWLLQRPNWRRGLVAGIAVAILTLNRDHIAFLGHVVLAAAALAFLGGRAAPLASLRRALPSIAVAVAVWLCLIALPLAVSLAYVADSNRPGFTAEYAAHMAIPWASLLSIPFPNLFNQLSPDGSAYWGPGSAGWQGYWIHRDVVQLACGIPAAAILFWLGVLRGGFLAAGARFGAALAVLALLYAVGTSTPFFQLAFDNLPGFALFQRPADATFPLNLGLALAMIGVADSYLRGGIAPVPIWRLSLELAVALGIVATALALASTADRFAQALPAVLGPAFVAALTVGILVVASWRGKAARTAAMGLVVLITVVDLAVHNAGTPLNARPTGIAAVLTHPRDDPVAQWLNQRLATADDSGPAPRVEILGLGGTWQNAPHVIGLDATLGYNPLRSSSYEMATGAGQNSHALGVRQFGTLMTGYASPFTDLLGVRYIVLGGPMAAVDPASADAFAEPTMLPGAALKGYLNAPEPYGDVYIYDNLDAVPRLVLVAAQSVRPHDPQALLASGALPAFDGRHAALIENPGGPTTPIAASPIEGTLHIERYGPDEVRLRVATDRDAWLVFHEMADPGWAAWVDGERRPLHRANVLFQAVQIPPGDHKVVFSYAPWRAAWALLRPAS